MTEAILEPDLPIIDPHHHLWDLRPVVGAFPEPLHPFVATIARTPYYTFNELHADATSGHNVIGTVYMECGAFYRAGASDAASALTLVSGATVQDGKFAVIRGLPDRYVSSQVNGVRLPYSVFENEPEVTDKPALLGEALERVFAKLWAIQREERH